MKCSVAGLDGHDQSTILEMIMGEEEKYLDDVLTDTRRRKFLQFCGAVAAGVLVPAFLSFRAGRSNDDYAVINGWVVPLSHLKVNIDA
jgi:hypothetical protein